MKEHSPLSYQRIEDAKAGDFDAYRMIVNEYSNALLSVAYSVLGDFHEAQDAVQEAFLKCYRNLYTLNDPAKLGSWLYAIAHRTSLDFAKRSRRTLPLDETALSSDNITPWLEQYVIHDSVWGALQELEEKSRSVVVLHYLSEWSMKEIGQFLNMSVSAVESRIRRAREVLKQHLARDFEHYFHTHRLGRDFEQQVSEQVLKRAGHFYIPVTDKIQATAWFILHFHLETSRHGNPVLESGQELYLLECQHHSPASLPVLTFEVASVGQLGHQLHQQGVRSEPIREDDVFGKWLGFYDPDGNKYLAIEKHG
ncbi:RNA polymerase subunit sigma-24 [Paenibacillus sp. LC231]|uniref:sigma-70 family RNA polymerase sigma factor n=1 Tax=Paenibacillus sp. LC231 TaxID=1120679 RepID=UPI0008DE45CA|nr:sigma-70 family RNA polymerase sigma factor [Paenibacillus sp. LC231]OIB01348.1 RNA polymerase subunit sigma-24 [Paenibacillus sp. LC231]